MTAPPAVPAVPAVVVPPVRIGVIGCGASAQIAHIPILTHLRGVSVIALCDNDGAKARTLAQRFQIPDYFTDIDDLFAADRLDAVVIATPSHLHEPHTLSAVRANVDVLCDRPLALSSRGAERVLAAAQKSGRKVLASHPLRYRADVQALMGFLRGGELGSIVGVRAGEYRQRGTVDGWRTRKQESGGGALMEYGYQLVDLALWLADSPAPERVSAHWVRGNNPASVEHTMVVLLTCAGGLACTFNVTWNYIGERDRWSFEILATQGSGRLSPLRVVKDIGGRPRDVSLSGAGTRDTPLFQSHRAESAHFLAVIRGEAPYEAPVEQVTVLRVIEGAYASADEGREVRF